MNPCLTRSSVRRFRKDPVDMTTIRKILASAMQAPSAGGEAPWEFYVIKNPDMLRQLSHVSPYASPVAQAPQAFVLCYDTNRFVFPEYHDIDMAITSENILIELEAQGLGGVFLGIAPLQDRMDKVRAVLGLPENLVPFNIIPFGYPLKKTTPPSRYDEKRVHIIS